MNKPLTFLGAALLFAASASAAPVFTDDFSSGTAADAGDYSMSLDDVSVSVIPEPTTMTLLGIALLSALAFKRRKA